MLIHNFVISDAVSYLRPVYRAPFIEQGLDIGPSYLSTQKGCVREYTMLLSEDKKKLASVSLANK